MLKVHKKKKSKFLFSIICATINNQNQIKKLCNSLKKQSYKKFELIICDQSQFSANKNIRKIYKNLKIKYINSNIGLSKSRNKGINISKGDYLIFLDDDITFEKNYLEKINNLLNKSNHKIISYSVVDNLDKPLLTYPKNNCYLENFKEIFNSVSSVSFVINSKNKILFDEKIGLGSDGIFQSGEETDLLIRAIKKFKYKIYFENSIKVIHQSKNIKFINQINKNFFYGCGWSYVVKKNKLGFYFTLKSILKIFLNIGYHIFTLNFKKVILSIYTILGRIYGFIK